MSYFDKLALIPRLELRPRLQILSGVVVMLLGLGVERLIWPWLGSQHLIALIPWVIIAAWFVGGSVAGLSAMCMGLLGWFIYFRPLAAAAEVKPIYTEGAAVVSYLLSGFAISLLGGQWLRALRIREEELERLEYAVYGAKVGIWEWNILEDTVQWDDRMLEFYGLTREQFGGKYQSWARGLHPEDAERATKGIEAALKNEADFKMTFRIVQPSGSIRYIHASAFVKRDAHGKPIAMYGLSRDVTDEVHTLSKFNEMNAFFQAAMDQSQVGIMIVDAPSGAIRFANDAALTIRGASRQELIEGVDLASYHSWQLVTLDGKPISKDQTPLARAFLSGQMINEEVGMINSRGELRVLLYHAAPIRREDGSISAGIAVFLDNTERHQLHKEVQAAREDAERALGAKSRFLDIAAHELRTPVTAFSLLLQVTQKKLAEGHPIDTSVLLRLRAQVDRLSRLVVDLLEVSRLDRGMLILKKEKSDLGRLINECISNFQLLYPARKFTLTTNNGAISAFIDPVRIYEVLSNMIDNAIRYSPEGSPIEIGVVVSAKQVRVSIRDHGHGISPERREALFRPFERGSSAHEMLHPGLGLGLYICKKIIELHEGKIELEETTGAGSTFCFELPRASVSQEAS